MRRTMLLVTVALMLAASMALSGVAQALTPEETKCQNLAVRTLGTSFDPANYTFIAGTAGNDDFNGQGTEGLDVFCGFGGDDGITWLDEGDIFLGGAGNDSVSSVGNREENAGVSSSIFYGGGGNDSILHSNNGTFNGGAGNDSVDFNYESATFNGGGGDDRITENWGTFNGSLDNDGVGFNYGTFYGGGGNDWVTNNSDDLSFSKPGTFYGGGGDDWVTKNWRGHFNGGPDFDRVYTFYSGSLLYVEQVN